MEIFEKSVFCVDELMGNQFQCLSRASGIMSEMD